MRIREAETKVIGGMGVSLVFLMSGVRGNQRCEDGKLHAEMTPECSRATSAAAHGAHGCCGMLLFF